MAKRRDEPALAILEPWLAYQVEWQDRKWPVHAWIDSKYNKVQRWQAVMRLTAGWPLNWALTKPTQPPIIWRHDDDRTSDFRGVSYIQERGLWRANVKSIESRCPKTIAWCSEEMLAAAVYNVCARYLYGPAARLNLT